MMEEVNKLKQGHIASLKESQPGVASKSEEISDRMAELEKLRREMRKVLGTLSKEQKERLLPGKVLGTLSKEHKERLLLDDSAAKCDESWKPTRMDESAISLKVESAVAGQCSRFTFTVMNECFNNEDISVMITDQTGQQIPNQLTKHAENQYKVSYKPRGAGTLSVTITPLPFPENKFEIKVGISTPFSIGEKGHGMCQFDYPRGLAVDSHGCLYVNDGGNRRIQKFGADGEFLSQFSTKRDDSGSYTYGLALNEARREIVCTEGVSDCPSPRSHNKVVIYDYDGACKNSFTDKRFISVDEVAVNSRGQIIVSDSAAFCLFMFDEQGQFLQQVDHYGWYITVDKDDTIIVSDWHTDMIKGLDTTGRLLREFGGYGSDGGQLSGPRGVAVHRKHIVVVDSGNKRMQVMTSDGAWVAEVPTGDADMYYIVVGGSGRVFVTNLAKDCINVYDCDALM